MQALAHVTLDKEQYDVYRIYKYNFEENIGKIKKGMSLDEIKWTLEKGCKTISGSNLRTIKSIIDAIHDKSMKYELPMDKIPVFNERFLPKDFETIIKDSVNQYGNELVEAKEAINSRSRSGSYCRCRCRSIC